MPNNIKLKSMKAAPRMPWGLLTLVVLFLPPRVLATYDIRGAWYAYPSTVVWVLVFVVCVVNLLLGERKE